MVLKSTGPRPLRPTSYFRPEYAGPNAQDLFRVRSSSNSIICKWNFVMNISHPFTQPSPELSAFRTPEKNQLTSGFKLKALRLQKYEVAHRKAQATLQALPLRHPLHLLKSRVILCHQLPPPRSPRSSKSAQPFAAWLVWLDHGGMPRHHLAAVVVLARPQLNLPLLVAVPLQWQRLWICHGLRASQRQQVLHCQWRPQELARSAAHSPTLAPSFPGRQPRQRLRPSGTRGLRALRSTRPLGLCQRAAPRLPGWLPAAACLSPSRCCQLCCCCCQLCCLTWCQPHWKRMPRLLMGSFPLAPTVTAATELLRTGRRAEA